MVRGRISRRRLLQSFSIAAVALPGASFAQQGGSGRPPAPRDTTPLVPPFEATGWNTVWLDHLSYRCVDYRKAAAFYATLMGWKVRSDDGKQAVLDIGENSGGIVIRGGLTAPPPAAITDAGLGVNRPPVQAVFDGFAWGITPWDTDKVKAELEKRGLHPMADHAGPDYQSFRVKDPDGFDVAVTNGTRALRRRTPATAKLPAPAPFAPTGWNTLYLDHISFEVPDFRRSAAFYQALLGWTMRPGNGSQVSVQIGDIGGAIIRGNAAARAAATSGTAAPAAAPRRGDRRDRAHQLRHRELEHRQRARRIDQAGRGLRQQGREARAAARHDRYARELPRPRRDGLGPADRQQDLGALTLHHDHDGTGGPHPAILIPIVPVMASS